jgi:hypothetical protein
MAGNGMGAAWYLLLALKVSRNVPPRNREERYSLLIHELSVMWGGCSTPHPGRITLGKQTRYPLYRRLGGARGLIWTRVENLAHKGLRTQKRPARSESPYRHTTPKEASYLKT